MTEAIATSAREILDRAARRRLKVIPILELALIVLFAALPALLPNYLTVFMTRVLILSLLALSFDLVWGYAGIMSFGQALFFGTAGYAVALMARDLGITSIFVLVPAALLIGLVLSFLIACFMLLGRHPPTLIFVSLGTLTGSYAADRLARGWYYLGGQNGIPSIPAMTAGPYDIDEGVTFYYLAFGILILVYLLCRFLVRSQFGLALAGIRQQELRISFLGYKVQHLKAVIFSFAGAIAGLAGGLYAFHEGFVWPNMLGVVLSTQVVLYALFGGVGTLIGAIIGVIAIEVLSYVLADSFQGTWPVILGLLLLVVIMLRPTGLIGLFVSERERIGSFGLGKSAPRRRH
ncbi:amino acid/amide ABC transporter membrane protein 2, HAAT family [Rhizobiales bacterium GAS191]|nr:amino acid/amide ABC transporter membrane protein 2, HAAT family [Rhizobiales bacterium GAS191]